MTSQHPPPSSRPGTDPKLLERVRGLLAKAEATTFPAEAEAFTAKAQELMARHSIDAAVLDFGAPAAARDAPAGHEVRVDDPYATPKSTLLAVVARANHCMVVWNQAARVATMFGYAVDVAHVEVLYTSLLVQATSAMTSAGTQVDGHGRSRTRSFRSSFLVAFAYRIGERLAEATEQATAEAAADLGTDVLPVLARRDDEVARLRDSTFPRLVRRSTTIRNPAGWVAGRAAADAAHLAPSRPLAARTRD